MHKINKILKKKNITSEDVEIIETCWNGLTYPTQKAKAICFYKEIKKHLSSTKIPEIEKSGYASRRFKDSLSILKEEIIFTKKLKLEAMIKIKIRRGKEEQNTNLNKTIINLLLELKNEKNFLRELLLGSNLPIRKLFILAIPKELAEMQLELI